MISLYPNIQTTTGGANADILTILEAIRTGRWKDQVEAVRSLTNEAEQIAAKKKLPYFTVSGTFTSREEKGLVQHSGFACLDADKKHNPGIDLLDLRERVQSDSYTFACFLSSRGLEGGLAIIARIPTEDHESSYRALKAYYEAAFGIRLDKTSNVAWPRYISYDPDLYLNTDSDVFDELAEEEPERPMPQTTYRPTYPTATTPQTHGQAALHTAIRKIMQAGNGERHDVRKRMSFLCGGYVATGLLSEHEAQQALESAIMQTSPREAWRDAFKTIASGLKKGQEKPILPDPLLHMVYEGKRHGDQKDLVTQKIAVSNGGNPVVIQQIVEKIYTEQEQTILAFWDVEHKEDKGVWVLRLSRVKYTRFLEDCGFRKYRQGSACTVVRVSNNIVEPVSRDRVKAFVLHFLEELPFQFDNIFRSQLIDQVMKEHRNFFDEGMMEFLCELPDNFVRDSKQSAFFYFTNCFVEVTAEGITPCAYDELPGFIWAEQVLPRKFSGVSEAQVLDGEHSEFSQFIFNISGADERRSLTLMSAIGYLLHGYKAPSNPRIIILVDETISENPSGGTGKGLVFKAISHMLPVESLDGKLFDFRDKFAFQGVTDATRVIVFEDWDGKRLPFDKLFNMATTMLKINRLYQGQVTIPYERAPKFGITTNDMVGGEGDSYARRKFEIEIAPHYNKDFKPSDEFGHDFFSDWSETEWNMFDNLMLYCCRTFLTSGLVPPVKINLNRRKLLQATSAEFVEFCDALKTQIQYYKHELWADFRAIHSMSEGDFKLDKFGKWLNHYIRYEDLTVEEGQTWEIGQYKGRRWLQITDRKKT